MEDVIVTRLRDLKQFPQWVCYSHKSKVPLNPHTGKGADCNIPESWASYDQARKTWASNRSWYAGLGFEFVKEQGLTGIDLDKCVDENGQIEAWAWEVIERLNSYTEYSPSGRGIHILVKGSIPSNLDSDPTGSTKVEMYDHQRYFTITGKHVPGTPETIEDRQEELTALHTEVSAIRASAKAPKQKSKFTEPLPKVESPYGTPYGLSALQAECMNMAMAVNGSRNTQLNRSAYALGQLLAGGELRDRAYIERELGATAAGVGLSDREIEHTMRSGLEDGLQEARSAPPKSPTWKDYEPTQEVPASNNGHQEPPPEPPVTNFLAQSPNLTDLGNAERFAAKYSNTVRWCETWNTWLFFNGRCWEPDRTRHVDQLAKVVVRSIYKEASNESDDDMRKRIAKHANASESSRAVRAMLDLAKSLLPAVPEDFNKHLYLLNCKNGTLDLRTGELKRQDPADMLTRCLKINYNPLAICQKWEDFIQGIFDSDQALIQFMKEALGMSLCGDTSEQCLFICHGSGSNGKTTMLETVRIIMEDYGLAANIETFQVRKNQGIGNDVAELYGARLVTASENTMGSRLNEAFIKKATGKEPLRARRLHENEFQFMPEFTIWFAVNHKPVVKDTSKGMWRRVHFIPFNVTIEGDKLDKHLGEKLLEESEGILTWLAQGCMMWTNRGHLESPETVLEATKAYRSEMDTLAGFLDEQCDNSGEVGATKLYQAYKAWCEENGERYEKQKIFGTQLTERGYEREKTREGIIYRGLSLLSVNDVNDVNDSSDFST